jgi:hypothetical protein
VVEEGAGEGGQGETLLNPSQCDQLIQLGLSRRPDCIVNCAFLTALVSM